MAIAHIIDAQTASHCALKMSTRFKGNENLDQHTFEETISEIENEKLRVTTFFSGPFTTAVVRDKNGFVFGIGTAKKSPLDDDDLTIGTNIAMARAFRDMWERMMG